MGTNDADGKTIQSTRTAFDVIETIAERDRPTASEVAAEVDHSRSTVHYHLKTLQREGYVVEEDHRFRLGLRMARLGALSLQGHRLTGAVERPAETLAAEANAVARVAVREQDRLMWLHRSSQEDDDPLAVVGSEAPIHSTAYGQAVLAYAPAETVTEVVEDRGLPATTEHTLTTREALDERLDTVRGHGFAYSAQEYLDGVSSIAAPITDGDGAVAGSIGISAAHDRIDDPYKHSKARRFSDELSGLVRKAARIASDRLADR